MASVLTKACELLAEDGRPITRDDVQSVVTRLFRTNFERWTFGG